MSAHFSMLLHFWQLGGHIRWCCVWSC